MFRLDPSRVRAVRGLPYVEHANRLSGSTSKQKSPRNRKWAGTTDSLAWQAGRQSHQVVLGDRYLNYHIRYSISNWHPAKRSQGPQTRGIVCSQEVGTLESRPIVQGVTADNVLDQHAVAVKTSGRSGEPALRLPGRHLKSHYVVSPGSLITTAPPTRASPGKGTWST